MGIQALIFGIDGTVAQTADLHRAAFNQAFAEFGLGWEWDRKIFCVLTRQLNDKQKLATFNATIATLDQATPQSAEVLAQLARRKSRIYINMLKSNPVAPRPGVARLITEARNDGILVAGVSTQSRMEFDALMMSMQAYGALEWFDNFQTANDLPVDPYLNPLFAQLNKVLDIEPRRILVVDHHESSISSAKLAGMNAIATPSLYTSSQSFKAADLVVSDLGEPATPFTILRGRQGAYDFISPQFLTTPAGPSIVAA